MALVTVFGGTGFLGRRIVERLLHGGAMVRVAVRQTKRIDLGTDSERAGPTTFVAADVRDEDRVAAAVAGAQGVVNAVSAYVERGGTTYAGVHELGGGRTTLQPVHVLDVAEAVGRSLSDPAAGGRIYELGGPESLTLREIIERILLPTGQRRLFIPVPFALAHPLARLCELLPQAPLTVAQVDLLKNDNVTSRHFPEIGDLGIAPRNLADAISQLPSRR